MRKYTHWSGLTKNTRNAAGIAPMNGPKKGITFVTPIMTLKSIGNGIFKIVTPMKQIIPIMRESTSLPMMKPPNI